MNETPKTKEPPLCKNCKHFRKKWIIEPKHGKCDKVMRRSIDYNSLVDGKPDRYEQLEYASIARMGQCGIEGLMFEQK